MSLKDDNVAILLDWRKNRIRIYKEVLYQLGKPSNICLLVNPEKMTIAIKGTGYDKGVTHKVDWNTLVGDRCFELYSKPFLVKLFNLKSDWDDEHNYRIHGTINKKIGVAEFNINDAISIDDFNGEEDE